jgi:hypothetical protein
VRITAVYGGTTRTVDVVVNVALAATPSSGSGGGAASGTVYGSTSSTTMTAVGDVLTVTVGSGGQVSLSADYDFTTSSVSGSYGEVAQWYWWNGSAYVALGSVSASSAYQPALGDPGMARAITRTPG